MGVFLRGMPKATGAVRSGDSDRTTLPELGITRNQAAEKRRGNPCQHSTGGECQKYPWRVFLDSIFLCYDVPHD